MQPLDSYRWPGLVSLQALEKCSLRCWDGMRRCPWQSSFSSVKRSVEFFHTYKYEKNRRHLVVTLELYFFDQIKSFQPTPPRDPVWRSSGLLFPHKPRMPAPLPCLPCLHLAGRDAKWTGGKSSTLRVTS